MQNGNNGNNSELKIEGMDSEFLNELNQLSKQLKTDDEIINDFKEKHSEAKTEKGVKPESKSNTNLDNNNIINDISGINNFLNSDKNTENPFKEAFNIMNSKDNIFNINDTDLMFESLESINSKVNHFNGLLKKTYGLSMENGATDNGNNNEFNEKENNILREILDFLIQSNLLKDTIFNMKKSIEESLEKNKNNLKKEENEKYQEALLNANNILNEMNNINPDKNKIMDSLQKLQQISNDVDSILFI